MSKTAYLVLENGQIFKGKSFGARREVYGETVFTTGMTGYLETLTDPSYYGQIIVQTFPLIGNYGIIPADFESNSIKARAYIVKDWCQEPSNFRCEGTLDAFLKAQKIPGLYDIDTRALTKVIRENGTMNGIITDDLNSPLIETMKKDVIHNQVEMVSTSKMYVEHPEGEEKYNVIMYDFGLKENIKRELLKRGCKLTVVPYDTAAKDVINMHPDGIMLSNGPGDPEDNKGVIEELKKLIDTDIPIFGICLGHQLLALANGFKTMKLKYGHRGANQPAMDVVTKRVFITSQNHGYAVMNDSIDWRIAKESFINVNDGTCEGIDYINHPVFSVQFHPEACSGPKDSGFLFDRFVNNMEVKKNATQQ